MWTDSRDTVYTGTSCAHYHRVVRKFWTNMTTFRLNLVIRTTLLSASILLSDRKSFHANFQRWVAENISRSTVASIRIFKNQVLRITFCSDRTWACSTWIYANFQWRAQLTTRDSFWICGHGGQYSDLPKSSFEHHFSLQHNMCMRHINVR